MDNIHKTAILLSFLSLWLTSYLNSEAQLFVGLSLIFSFGILHGANDLALISHLDQHKTSQFVKILSAYVILVLASAVLFMQIPTIALVLFIVVSAYHFGEQNWNDLLASQTGFLISVFQITYGLIILSALFCFNTIEVQKIIFKIAYRNYNENQFFILLVGSFLLYIIIGSVLVLKNQIAMPKFIEQSLYMLMLFIIFKTANLILGFAVYFIFWHSIPSLHDQIKFLYGSFSFENFKKYFKSSFLYWIVSLFGVAMFYLIAKDQVIFDALFFSFLASITFPHFIVMLSMYKK